MTKAIDITGQKFGRLTVLRQADRRRWECLCVCGKVTTPTKDRLRCGRAKSCGCLAADLTKERQIKHEQSHTRTYRIWQGMCKRCYNEKAADYPKYGGKGIYVEDSWHTFEGFYRDMGLCPQGLTLDRIDGTGPYSKDNCRWATYTEQLNNRKNNVKLTYGGVTLTLSEWSDRVGLHYRTLRSRIKIRGWSIEDALTTPANSNCSSKSRVQRIYAENLN